MARRFQLLFDDSFEHYVFNETAAPRLVSTHVPLFAILYHLHLLRMYVRRWARTRTL